MLAVVTPKCAGAGLKDWTCTWPDRWYTGVCLVKGREVNRKRYEMPEEKWYRLEKGRKSSDKVMEGDGMTRRGDGLVGGRWSVGKGWIPRVMRRGLRLLTHTQVCHALLPYLRPYSLSRWTVATPTLKIGEIFLCDTQGRKEQKTTKGRKH